MANIPDVRLKLSVEGGNVRATFLGASDDLKKFTESAKTAGAASVKTGGQVDQLTEEVARLRQGMEGFQSLAGKVFAFEVFRRLTTDLIQTRIQFQQIQFTLQAVTGDANKAAAEFEYVRAAAETYGISLQQAGNGYAKLLVAGKTANIEVAQSRELFEGLAAAATTLHLSTGEVEGAIFALGQSFSKGTFNSEELKYQLGERIPGLLGAFKDILAKKNVDLEKELANGGLAVKKYVGDLAEAFVAINDPQALKEAQEGLNANLARLNTAYSEFKAGLSKGPVEDVVLEGVKLLTELLKVLNGTVGQTAIAYGIVGASGIALARSAAGVYEALLKNLAVFREGLAATALETQAKTANTAATVLNTEATVANTVAGGAATAARRAQIAGMTTLTAATVATTVATSGASVAMAGLARTGSLLLGLVGGLPGALFLAAGGLAYFLTRTSEAEKKAEDFAKSLNELRKAAKSTDITAKITIVTENLKETKAEVAGLITELNRLRSQKPVIDFRTGKDANATRIAELEKQLAGKQSVLAETEAVIAQKEIARVNAEIEEAARAARGSVDEEIDRLRVAAGKADEKLAAGALNETVLQERRRELVDAIRQSYRATADDPIFNNVANKTNPFNPLEGLLGGGANKAALEDAKQQKEAQEQKIAAVNRYYDALEKLEGKKTEKSDGAAAARAAADAERAENARLRSVQQTADALQSLAEIDAGYQEQLAVLTNPLVAETAKAQDDLAASYQDSVRKIEEAGQARRKAAKVTGDLTIADKEEAEALERLNALYSNAAANLESLNSKKEAARKAAAQENQDSFVLGLSKDIASAAGDEKTGALIAAAEQKQANLKKLNEAVTAGLFDENSPAYKSALAGINTLYDQTVKKAGETNAALGQFAIQAARTIQTAFGSAIELGLNGQFSKIGPALGDAFQKATANILSNQLLSQLFGSEFDKTGKVGGLLGSVGGLLGLGGDGGKASAGAQAKALAGGVVGDVGNGAAEQSTVVALAKKADAFFGDVFDGAKGATGETLTDLLGSFFGDLFSSLGGGGGAGGFLSSAGSALGGLFGFSEGGFTGSGPVDEVAGFVHGGEHVINAKQTAKYGPLLDMINRDAVPSTGVVLKGYASGGKVEAAKGATTSAGAASIQKSMGSNAHHVTFDMSDDMKRTTVGELMENYFANALTRR